MSGLLDKLKGGKRHIRVIKFPGTDQDVALRVLNNSETQEALFATERHFRDKEIEVTLTTAEAFEDENTTQILFRALRNAEDPSEPLAASPDELRRALTREEKDHLVELYLEFEKEISPSAANMSEEEMEALFEDLKKTPELGNNLSSGTLKRLIGYLASRPSS